jgi:hypothetical protein
MRQNGRMSRTIAATLLLATLLMACGGDEPDRPAGGSPGPEASVTAEGDLLVYSHQIGEESGASRVFPVLEVVIYDIGAKRGVSAFRVGGANAYPLQIVFAGDRVVVNLETRIVAYALDGSDETVLRQAATGGSFIGIGASPDSTKLAYTEQTGPYGSAQGPDGEYISPYPAVTEIAVVSLDDGAELVRIPQSDPGFEGYVGQAALVNWRHDNRGFTVSGYTYSEAPGGLATVMLDGSVRVHDISGYAFASPNGRLIADDSAQWCDLGSPPENHDLRIVDLDTGEALGEFRDEVKTLQWKEWSPDGTELLFERYGLVDVTGHSCPQRGEESEWMILGSDGGTAEAIAGPSAARERWYEDPLTYTCEGEAQVDPYCIDETGQLAPVAVAVNGEPVAEVSEFRLVGFIDTP